MSSALAGNSSSENMEGCCVCADDTGSEDNPLVYCDGKGCNVCVHKACYGIRAIPTGDWFCSKCAYLRAAKSDTGSSTNSDSSPPVVKCELCPATDGAFKPTTSGKWAHVVCALYIKEAQFLDSDVMEPIVTATLPKELFQRSCYICLEKVAETEASTGACTVCEKNGCKKAFHVTCAQKKGLLCEIQKKNNKLTVVYSGYCGEHIPPSESGLVDGHRYRKIPPYPRLVTVNVERGSSSSGYSTPNNPDKSPNQPQNTEPVLPQSTLTENTDNQRSSSIKSTASVGSSNGTTESADSGIQTAVSDPTPGPPVLVVQSVSSPAPSAPVVEEQRAIRKPHKKSFRMDTGNPSPGAPPTFLPTSTPSVPAIPMVPTPPSSGNLPPYFASNPFVSPQELQAQIDLSQRSHANSVPPPLPVVNRPSSTGKHGEGSPMMQYGNPKMPPMMPNQAHPGPNRKRPLSPSILDSDTLTISSLIERTIERATTSTTTMPPVSIPFTTGVRPGFMEENGMKHSPDMGQKGPKQKRAAKESKADARRGANTATIKDLLASSKDLSPQQGGHASPQSDQQSGVSQMNGPLKGNSRGVSGMTMSTVAVMEQERLHQSQSPFAKEKALSPKTLNNLQRQQEDRQRTSVEKVQHYLTNHTPDMAMDRPPSASNQPPAPKAKRKPQERKSQQAKAGNNPAEDHMGSVSTSRSNRETDASARRTNGYVNGTSTMSPEPDVDTPAGAQAFDNLMMSLSTYGAAAAHSTAANNHPTAAMTLDGYFRMQRELNTLKEKVGELEGLKAFYLSQVQALRSLAEKHAADGGYAAVQPSVPEEVARLLSVLGEPHEESQPAARNRGGNSASDNASDGLLARLHEPGTRDTTHRSPRDSRPASRAQTSTTSSAPSSANQPQYSASQPHLQNASPSQTPKPYSRSRNNREPERERDRERERDSGTRERERDRERERERGGEQQYASTNGYSASGNSGSSRRTYHQHLEGMDGISSGVISTPAPVVSTPQLMMPNVGGAQFILPNQQLYQVPMVSPQDAQRMMAMFPGQAFFPSSALYGGGVPGMGGFIQAPSASDFTGLGRMHSAQSARYSSEDASHGSSSHHQHNSIKRDYEGRDAS